MHGIKTLFRVDMLARDQAGKLGTDQGSILRLTADGKPASGNPLASRAGARPEIWTYGHRNIQGLARDPVSGRVWATEHGPRGGDELNLIAGGQNYGWPLQSYGADYRTGEPMGQRTVAGMTAPKVAWVPSPGRQGQCRSVTGSTGGALRLVSLTGIIHSSEAEVMYAASCRDCAGRLADT